MKKSIAAVLAIIIQVLAYSQNAATLNGKILTKAQATEDLTILYATLVNYHPQPFAYIAPSEFTTYFESLRAALPDTLGELAFHYECRKLLAKIGCGHTYARPSKAWYASVKEKNVLIPFEVSIINGRLFVKNTVEGTAELAVNDEIISIDGEPVERMLERMAMMQERDGITESFIHALIEKRFRTYLLFLKGVQEKYEIEAKTSTGATKKVTLESTNRKITEPQPQGMPPGWVKIYENKWSTSSYDSLAQVAYLRISSFSDRKEFKEYYQTVFRVLQEKQIAKLIIDIRDNPGGYFVHGNKFLTYLTPHPFELNFQKPKGRKPKNKNISLIKWNKLTKFAFSLKRQKYKVKGQRTTTFKYKPSKYLFEGKVYVVTNGVTFSQAALVAAQLKENGAVIVGQETGGTETGCNGILSYDLLLPNSQINVSIPVYHVQSNSTQGQSGYGVKPHQPIQPVMGPEKDHALHKLIQTLKEEDQ